MPSSCFSSISDHATHGRHRLIATPLATFLTAALLLAGQAIADTAGLVQANSRFAFDLYQRVKGGDASGNLFCSPHSISECLAMVYAGAAGATATQMASVLHFNSLAGSPHDSFGQLDGHLQQIDAAGDVRLAVANGMWVQQDYVILPAFTQTIQNDYRGALFQADFAGDAEGAREQINTWVEEATYDKIQDLIPPGALTDATRLVLANTIYFKGMWLFPFDPALTSDETFYLTNGTTTAVSTMHQTAEFSYMEDSAKQVISLPYMGGDISMIVILPKAVNGLAAVEAGLDAQALNTCLASLAQRNVELALPKFRVESEFSLSDTLAAMGMPAAFDPNVANFSGMDGTRNLYISFVIHKAFVQIDEEGTEAAASTAAGMGTTSAPSEPVAFRADHPFLFLIRDNSSGAILFVGRVADPPPAPEYTSVDAAEDYLIVAEAVVSDWMYSDWLGYLWVSEFPWTWSPDQEWLYCAGQGGDNIRLWLPKFGWLWTAPNVYPWFWNWSPKGGRWLWHTRTGSRNQFYPL